MLNHQLHLDFHSSFGRTFVLIIGNLDCGVKFFKALTTYVFDLQKMNSVCHSE